MIFHHIWRQVELQSNNIVCNFSAIMFKPATWDRKLTQGAIVVSSGPEPRVWLVFCGQSIQVLASSHTDPTTMLARRAYLGSRTSIRLAVSEGVVRNYNGTFCLVE